MLSRIFRPFIKKKETKQKPAYGDSGLEQVTSDASRCIQCGICINNCPVGIEVREYARRGENVTDSRCIGCGTCIKICPRGTLRWGPAILIRPDNTLVVTANELPAMLHLHSRKLK
jgi:ferredoxin